MKTNVLILSATASAINYRNALRGRSDLRLHFTDASPFAAALYEPGVCPLLVPPARSREQYRAALDRIIARHRIDILIPTSDHDTAGVMDLVRQGWDPPVAMFRPDYGVYRDLVDKVALTRKLNELGAEVPRPYEVSEITDDAFPLVIKPAREGGSKGVWIVDDRRQFDERYAAVRAAYGEDIAVQEFVPGATGSIYVALLLYGQDGQLYGEVATRSTLTFMTWGGGGNAGHVVDEPGLLRQARDIIEQMGGWRGPVNLEFKRHAENGRFYLMEVNCRLHGYSYLATMNGLDFPAAVIELLRSGGTEFLRPQRGAGANFVVGFREMPVDDWAVVWDADATGAGR